MARLESGEEARLINPYQPPGIFESNESNHDRIRSLANKSLIYGVVGLFCCGLIFGPIAINYANQAEAAIIGDPSASHISAHKAGKVLGYLAVAFWALGFLLRLARLAF